MTAYVFDLPALFDEGPMPSPDKAGEWLPAFDLAGLAKSLKLASDQAKIDDIKSIPDAWAQAQVFHQALLEPSHELHDDAVRQWRGLLTLFALQPWFDTVYDLQVTTVALGMAEAPDQRFRRMLKALEPQVRLTPDAGWDPLGVVSFREKGGGFVRGASQPIALLSPVVLVTPGKSAIGFSHPKLPWLINGLSDPLDCTGLSPEHWTAIARYLEALAASLPKSAEGSPSAGLFDDLNKRLQQFHDKCMERVVEPATLMPATLDLEWPLPLYQGLGLAYKLDATKILPGDSRCALSIRPEAARLFSGVVLIDPALEKTLGRPAEQIRAWERYSLRDAASPQTLAWIKADAADKGYLVIEPEDLFTPYLIKFKPGTEVQAHNQSFRAALMPFSPLALLLFSPETLTSGASLLDDRGRHKVELTLPLMADPARPQAPGRHVMSKVFADADVNVEDRPDDLALWPNFRAPEWRWTFLRFQYDPEYELQTRFAVSADFIGADIETKARQPADRIRAARDWASSDGLALDTRLFSERSSELRDAQGKLLMQRLRFAQTDRLVGEHQHLPYGAEAVFFARRREGRGSERPVGLAIIEFAPTNENFDKATVSVDFGTTNTVAYQRRGETLQALTFQDRLLFPIKMNQREDEQRRQLAITYTDFFPLRDHRTPFPTVAKRREFSGAPPPELSKWMQKGHPAQGFSDNIFFVPQFEKFAGVSAFLDWIKQGRLIFNIKWSKDEYTRELTRRFLRQVMVMAAAELAAAGVAPPMISWKFSYPEAFSRSERDHLFAYIQLAWKDLFADQPSTPAGAPPVEFETEADAAARYFMKDERQDLSPAGDLMLMLDIGGGTTDVALWYKEQMRWRNSYKLAGGAFFTRYLANNIEILKKIDFDEVAGFVEGNTGASAESSANFVELFVNAPTFGPNFERKYVSFAAEPEGAGLRECASVALGGLMHYMGLVIRRLIEQGLITNPESAIRGLTIAFAGRGSALFRLFDVGQKYDTDLARLAGVLVAAAGQDPAKVQVNTLFSAEPKHEVARGMLALGGSSRADLEPQRWTVAPAGDALVTANKGGLQTVLAAADLTGLFEAEDIEEVQLTEMRAFLTSLRRQTGISVDLDNPRGEGAKIIAQRTVTELRRKLKELTQDDIDDANAQALEPPFILELRTLVELMSLPLAQRNARILVKERNS